MSQYVIPRRTDPETERIRYVHGTPVRVVTTPRDIYRVGSGRKTRSPRSFWQLFSAIFFGTATLTVVLFWWTRRRSEVLAVIVFLRDQRTPRTPPDGIESEP
ncbi:hypothetical protein F5Y06DRAFT_299534 [Hypoxylon sp. FL0890]|nr:hypothetical protein F5Y06DRAFT_299534 [Hypoxylon sp. FL0890]